MINETMTVEERMQAAIAVEPVDRHPVFPIMFTAAVRLYGRTQAEAWADHGVIRGTTDQQLTPWTSARELTYPIGSQAHVVNLVRAVRQARQHGLRPEAVEGHGTQAQLASDGSGIRTPRRE